MKDMGISVEDRRCYLKVKSKFIRGQKIGSFSDAVKSKGVEFYKQTHFRLMHFLKKASSKEKFRVLWEESKMEND